ncbi:MAG: hypothetical protein FWF91_06275 [Coriobacteriia bacterium]|nr:hypothetical protein [Coriobacteriia bacterium]
MNAKVDRRFYFLSLAVLAVLSAYPLINGIQMAWISITNGALEPEQYVRYVVPYAAICVALLCFAALHPVFMRLKRFAFPVGIATTFLVFFVVERFFETIQIHVAGMTLIDTATLIPYPSNATATADSWQAALCIASPEMRWQSLTYASLDNFYYVMDDSTYKIHYYLIALILITMVCGLIHGIARMLHLRSDDRAQAKPLFLQGISTAALVALCVFANSTAFFRQTAYIQTPLASLLTGLFFVALGAAVGVYVGSFLLERGRHLRLTLPVLLSLGITILMYVGESLMMKGNLYRFGTGWFFEGLPGLVAAPVDILVILLAGGLTWLVLSRAQKHMRWANTRTAIVALVLCAAVAAVGPAISLATPKTADAEIFGCYVVEKNLYTSPLSSYLVLGETPLVYSFDESTCIIADTEEGSIRSFAIEYDKTPVSTDEFSSRNGPSVGSLTYLPNLAHFKERYLLAVISDDSGPRYGLYRMDRELWLVELGGVGIWSIYRLERTDTVTRADLLQSAGLVFPSR